MKTLRRTTLIAVWWIPALALPIAAAEYHVSPEGDDARRGTRRSPLRTIQRAADLAQPGDVITVHAGIYRERVNPPRGGTSDRNRIVYQAARGETVEIRGSEVVTNWVRVQGDVWQATVPNGMFGAFNPYTNEIRGDWFNPKGRPHHTGAVYVNGHWLVEAASRDEVLDTSGAVPSWWNASGSGYLVNIAWLQPAGRADAAGRVPAAAFAAQRGVQKAACEEGGECLGWIEAGDWVRYERVDFGTRCERLAMRVASASEGGVIEARLDQPDGALLGRGVVGHTGGWQSWTTVEVPVQPMSGVQSICLVFRAGGGAQEAGGSSLPGLWFAQVDAGSTVIWAQFQGLDPREALVEINVRRTVFYPDQPGRNFITVRGFALRHAATPWAPPTAEQIGLIGTHWSRGWVIEDNEVSHSICSGIALGKHGDQWDNTSADTAEGYVKTIERAHARGWTRETIGHHRVRNNTIHHCEQAGIVGSLGAAFCTVTGNTIHDIHMRRLFTGAEMAGIKFHAAIDSVIAHNHIYRTCLGLWLDWMAQGTRVSANLFHDNDGQDLFVEVDHGPFLVDNNVFLSRMSVLNMSEGGAYAHNLFAGRIVCRPEPGRETPYHPAHSTTVAGLKTIRGGDDRFFNNVFVGTGAVDAAASKAPGKDPEWRGGHGLWGYDYSELPIVTGGNVYYRGAQPHAREADAVVVRDVDPRAALSGGPGRWTLAFDPGTALGQAHTRPVTTERLGLAAVPRLPYENADGTPLSVDRDYLGRKRSGQSPTPGPFEGGVRGSVVLRDQR